MFDYGIGNVSGTNSRVPCLQHTWVVVKIKVHFWVQ